MDNKIDNIFQEELGKVVKEGKVKVKLNRLLKEGDVVYGIGYVIESYGLIRRCGALLVLDRA